MMYKKICPECDSASYSSGKKGEWICPYCDEDIGDIEVERTKEDGD